MIDRKRLRELALAATPGPWRRGGQRLITDADDHNALAIINVAMPDDTANALCFYIAAADPQTILALLDALEAQPDDARIPREPTEVMLAAVDASLDALMAAGKPVGDAEIWRAMWDAAVGHPPCAAVVCPHPAQCNPEARCCYGEFDAAERTKEQG